MTGFLPRFRRLAGTAVGRSAVAVDRYSLGRRVVVAKQPVCKPLSPVRCIPTTPSMVGARRRAWRGDFLPEHGFLAALFGNLGAYTNARHAVIISAGNSAGVFGAAARVYWTLKIAGHGKVSLLDGGMATWQREPVEAGPHPATPAANYRSNCVTICGATSRRRKP